VRIGMSAFCWSYRCGLIGQNTERANPTPLPIDELIRFAVAERLQSLEFPAAAISGLPAERIDALAAQLAAADIRPILDSGVVDVARLQRELPAAAQLGVRVVRVLVSPVMEGRRGAFERDWSAHLDEIAERLRQIEPLAREHGIRLALENHQDVTADDLAALCRRLASPTVGVCFDVTNCLMVGEQPFRVLQQLAPYIVNVHLSDYEAYPTEHGWRIVRCALGDGELDLRGMLQQVAALEGDVCCQIELANHTARHARLLDDDWWRGYPQRDIREVLPALRMLAQTQKLRDDDWRTPWERGADAGQITQFELQQVSTSLQYLRKAGVLQRNEEAGK
jgi:sugar phosphate isomerase/epimerase